MPSKTKVPRISEKAFMAQVVQLAVTMGFRTYHTHDSRHSASGFPDLIICKSGRPAIAAELKVGRNTLTAAQAEWLEVLDAAGLHAYCWFPSDWKTIERVLGVTEVNAHIRAGCDAVPCPKCRSLQTVRSGRQWACEGCQARWEER